MSSTRHFSCDVSIHLPAHSLYFSLRFCVTARTISNDKDEKTKIPYHDDGVWEAPVTDVPLPLKLDRTSISSVGAKVEKLREKVDFGRGIVDDQMDVRNQMPNPSSEVGGPTLDDPHNPVKRNQPLYLDQPAEMRGDGKGRAGSVDYSGGIRDGGEIRYSYMPLELDYWATNMGKPGEDFCQ